MQPDSATLRKLEGRVPRLRKIRVLSLMPRPRLLTHLGSERRDDADVNYY